MTDHDFRQIIDRYQRPVIAVIYKLVFDWEVARDLAQDVFVSFWKSRAPVDKERALFTLLYRIAVNRAIDHLRQNKIVLFPVDDSATAPDTTTIESRELWRILRQCAHLLAPLQRAIFTLRDLEGLSFEDISAVIKRPVGTVRSSLHLARRTIKNHLKEKYPEVLYEYGL